MVRVLLEFVRNELHQLLLDLERILAGRDPGAVRDAEYVGVDRDRRLPEGDVENHVSSSLAGRGLAARSRVKIAWRRAEFIEASA